MGSVPSAERILSWYFLALEDIGISRTATQKFRTATEFLELAEAVEYEEFDQPISIWYVPTEFTGFDGPSIQIHLELQFFIPELTTGILVLVR